MREPLLLFILVLFRSNYVGKGNGRGGVIFFTLFYGVSTTPPRGGHLSCLKKKGVLFTRYGSQQNHNPNVCHLQP